MQNKVLLELARQVRGDTLTIFEATRNEQLLAAPAGTSNHILWHAGHALWLQDLMCVALLCGKSELPPGWVERFAANSQPRQVTEWPSREQVGGLLQAQLDRMLELLAAATDDRLDSKPTHLRGTRTCLGWIIHGLHDEAKHSGEMYLLWKLDARPK